MSFTKGLRVRLRTPDNPHLDGEMAVVKQATEYGAVVSTKWGSGEFRALDTEMEVIDSPKNAGYTGSICPHCLGSKMIRSGSCETCMDCGTPSGCS